MAYPDRGRASEVADIAIRSIVGQPARPLGRSVLLIVVLLIMPTIGGA